MYKRKTKFLGEIHSYNGLNLAQIILVSLSCLIIGCARTGYFDAPLSNFSDQVVIHFHREGGILPISENWRFYHDGRLEDSGNNIYRLDTTKFAELLQLCQQIPDNYVSPATRSCPDCYQITLNLDCDSTKKTISILEGIAGTPAYITALIKSVRRTISTRTLI